MKRVWPTWLRTSAGQMIVLWQCNLHMQDMSRRVESKITVLSGELCIKPPQTKVSYLWTFNLWNVTYVCCLKARTGTWRFTPKALSWVKIPVTVFIVKSHIQHPHRKLWVPFWFLIFDFWFLIFDFWFLIFDFWFLIFDFWFLIFDFWFLIFDFW